MNAWTNTNTGHNRYISTGPTPDGKVNDLVIDVRYSNDSGIGDRLYMGLALDGHIVPLILRVPEMRDALLECDKWIRELYSRSKKAGDASAMEDLLHRIEALTAPTREESDASVHS